MSLQQVAEEHVRSHGTETPRCVATIAIDPGRWLPLPPPLAQAGSPKPLPASATADTSLRGA